jgi:FixJ family two-component response regulator
MSRRPATVLVVDDEVSVTDMLYEDLTQEGYDCITAGTGGEALQKLSAHGADVVLLDLKLPDFYGMEILREIKSTRPEMAVIVITSYGDIETAVEAIRIGATDFIIKPFELDRINRGVADALQTDPAPTSMATSEEKSRDSTERPTDWIRYLDDIARGVETKLDSQTDYLMMKAIIERTESTARNLGIPEPHIEDWVSQKRRHIERVNTLDIIMDKL